MSPIQPSQPSPSDSSSARSRIPNVVTIAGVDPSGGAGVFADLKTFCALGAFGCGVVAALTAQNTQAVTGVHVPPTDFLRLQIDTLFADVQLHATKIGMLGSADVTATVADRLGHWQARNVVLDPVMVAKSGDSLLRDDAVEALIELLVPRATVITPNLPEARRLTGLPVGSDAERARAAAALAESGPAVLLKGGHGDGDPVVDLFHDRGSVHRFTHARIETTSTHGTGCTLSAAIAAGLAAGRPLRRAVGDAIDYLQGAIAAAFPLGRGHGPVDHLYRGPGRTEPRP